MGNKLLFPVDKKKTILKKMQTTVIRKNAGIILSPRAIPQWYT